MKKIKPINVLSLMLLSSLTYAADAPNGLYLKGSLENLNLSTTNPTISASLGYKMKNWRAEAQYMFAQRTTRYSAPWDHYKTRSYFNDVGVNGYYDFDNATIFSPYLGLGLHENFAKFDSNAFSSHTLYVAGLAGVRAYVSKNVALDLSLRAPFHHNSTTRSIVNSASVGLGGVFHFD